jgi:hypothetical protein
MQCWVGEVMVVAVQSRFNWRWLSLFPTAHDELELPVLLSLHHLAHLPRNIYNTERIFHATHPSKTRLIFR